MEEVETTEAWKALGYGTSPLKKESSDSFMHFPTQPESQALILSEMSMGSTSAFPLEQFPPMASTADAGMNGYHAQYEANGCATSTGLAPQSSAPAEYWYHFHFVKFCDSASCVAWTHGPSVPSWSCLGLQLNAHRLVRARAGMGACRFEPNHLVDRYSSPLSDGTDSTAPGPQLCHSRPPATIKQAGAAAMIVRHDRWYMLDAAHLAATARL